MTLLKLLGRPGNALVMYLDEQKFRQGRDADAGSVCGSLSEGCVKKNKKA